MMFIFSILSLLNSALKLSRFFLGVVASYLYCPQNYYVMGYFERNYALRLIFSVEAHYKIQLLIIGVCMLSLQVLVTLTY